MLGEFNEMATDYPCRPVKTFNTAVVYYHKFRLQHSDGEYSFVVSLESSATSFTTLVLTENPGCGRGSAIHGMQS